MEPLNVRRRSSRKSPLKKLRIGAALQAGAGAGSAIEFPGIDIPEPESARGRILKGGLPSLVVHGAMIAALFLAAWFAPIEEVEELIKLTHIKEAERVDEKESAPAPRVVAEARAAFNPAPMAVAPQIVNPAVIRQAAPTVQAKALDMETLNTVQGPREVKRAARVVERASAYQSQAKATVNPVAIDASAPAIRGPVEIQAPSGIQSGPRQVVGVGNTVGIADPQALGTGSAVREGISSNRDVLGAQTGARASVDWQVGNSNMRGRGGNGSGPGGITFDECLARPEVQSYMERVRMRMLARWSTPAEAAGDQEVQLRFVLDPAGTALRVELVSARDPRLGKSAVDALRSASPFDHMPDRVRCLAGNALIGTFRNRTVVSN